MVGKKYETSGIAKDGAKVSYPFMPFFLLLVSCMHEALRQSTVLMNDDSYLMV